MGARIAWVSALALVVAGAAAVVLWTAGLLPLPESRADSDRAERLRKPAEQEEPSEDEGAGNTDPAAAGATAAAAAASAAVDPGVATFGGGCFWCTEAIFQQLKGVRTAVPGYSGGDVKDPTYEQVCGGDTGHAEVVRVTYDPRVITYPELLEVFWKTHDPTTLNKQGADVGTQYRSVIFYHSQQQKEQAEKYRKKLDQSGAFDGPIVTQIVPAAKFYPAEKYHHDYFLNNKKSNGYCQFVIVPKLKKFEEAFADKLKPVEGK